MSRTPSGIALLVMCLAIVPVAPTSAQAPAPPDRLMERARTLFQPIPTSPPAQRDNPLTPEKLALGKMLFFEPRLSASWFLSCSSCHSPATAGADYQPTSVGHGWQRGRRNAPTVLNAVFNIAQFWDGRAEDLKQQAKGPVEATVEMNNTPERVVATLEAIPEYKALFARAFPGDARPVSFENMARAIAAFEATLITPNARFDRFLRGDVKALTEREKEGLRLFIDRGCANCHEGINVGGGEYQPFGVVQKPGAELLPESDPGRFAVTRTASDQYVFKVPSLRNVALTPPYFHTGQVWDLRQAVAIMADAQLGATLSSQEIDAITDFLDSLTGDMPRVELPVLPPIGTGGPPPHVQRLFQGPLPTP